MHTQLQPAPLGPSSMEARLPSADDGQVAGAFPSDQHLLAAVQRREPGALSQLYDRYAPLVFTLACSSTPTMAEYVTEGVFIALWHTRVPASGSRGLLATLLELSWKQVQRCGRQRRNVTTSGPPAAHFAALRPFMPLPPGVFEVMVLTTFGQLSVPHLAGALAVDPTTILDRLAVGLRLLRDTSAQPTVHASGSGNRGARNSG